MPSQFSHQSHELLDILGVCTFWYILVKRRVEQGTSYETDRTDNVLGNLGGYHDLMYQKSASWVLIWDLQGTLQLYYYGFLIDQGLLTEVPLDSEIFTKKVVAQTIQGCSTNKMSKMQSNGSAILGLVNYFILYCNFHKLTIRDQPAGLK